MFTEKNRDANDKKKLTRVQHKIIERYQRKNELTI